jgi:Tfp pilus assembly protein PilN
VLAVVGAALQLWGVHRQLDIVRAERAQLAPRLSATLIGRTSVEAVTRNVMGLNAVERASPGWAHTIGTLTSALPDGAYLTAFRTRGDSIVVEGLAQQASDVFNAMEQLPQLANVRAGAPVRRELQDDMTPLERFTIIALQLPPATAAATPATGVGR